jgi:predicted helicase
MFALKQRLTDYPMMLSLFNMYLYNKDGYLQFLAQWIKWFRETDREVVILFSTNKLAKKLSEIFYGMYPEYINETLVLKGDSKQDSLQIAKEENKLIKEKLKEYKESLNEKVKAKELKRKDADLLYKAERIKAKDLQEINIQKALDLYYQKIKDAKILISNFNLLREGFDKSSLSGIIFGSPIIGKITVVQSLGRITRLHEDKPEPIALFPIIEAFETLNKSVTTIIRNNVLNTYPNAKITYM